MTLLTLDNPTADELRRLTQHARRPRVRTMRNFAEAEIVIPDGPYRGTKYRADRQPYAGLWFDEIDSGRWRRAVATGPSQSGKTLTCFVIPALWHLFEIGETIILGLPSMEIAADKWRQDLLPAIEASRFADLLPRTGAGSKGGIAEALQFRNGATLRFMSGGGSDKKRSAFTARVLLVTEVDGMDEAGAESREADKVAQLEARLRAYGSAARTYLECTTSIETGRTWREYIGGTHSRIALPCPHCRGYVTPEREHLLGHQEAATVTEARARSAFHCPACAAPWSEQERVTANRTAILLHDGQEITPAGEIVGDEPQTDTLGFRWSAVNNLFTTAADLGADEWRARRDPNEENAEKLLRQFIWAVPFVSAAFESEELVESQLIHRTRDLPRGIAPPDAQRFTVGVDLGKHLGHWLAAAWTATAQGHVIDYGRFEVAGTSLPIEQAILQALREFRDTVEAGWPWPGQEEPRKPDQVWIDAGYFPEAVHAFVRESGPRYRAIVGRGAGQQRQQWYNRPKSTGAVVKHLGDEFHISALEGGKSLVEINADFWKTRLHERLRIPVDAPGALTFFGSPNPNEHLSLAKHLTAERRVEEFIAGRGTVTRWECIRQSNHWLDTSYIGLAASSFVGVSLIERRRSAPARPVLISAATTRPDGRPW